MPGSPYFVLADGRSGQVRGEGTGMTWPQVLGMIVQSTADDALALDDLDTESRIDQELLAQGIEHLAELQDRLYADNRYGVLVVLQALDAAGKDGTIRHVMSGVNPQGVVVSSFKVPSVEELDHDYLWRYALKLPRRGEIEIGT